MAGPRHSRIDRLSGLAVGLAIRSLVGGIRRLDPVRCSNAGGWIARLIGPRLPVSRIGLANLAMAFPDMDDRRRRAVLRGVWDNLGRTVAELPHLARFARTGAGPGWEVVGEEHLAPLRPGSGEEAGQALFFSGHLGNWEMVLPIASALGLDVSGVYRAASSRVVDAQLQAMRQAALSGRVRMFAKGAQGARLALAHLGRGGSLGLLVDQKMNDGVAVPFFGRDAMTAPALAQFALRFAAPVMPIHVVRLGPARFRMVCEPPLQVVRTGDRAADMLAILRAMNQTLERWIREDPSSWLWLHRRWPKAASPPPQS